VVGTAAAASQAAVGILKSVVLEHFLLDGGSRDHLDAPARNSAGAGAGMGRVSASPGS
jgi:hypothetical protein